MKILKILNNNVVTIRGKSGQEKVVMGRGIAFNKKKGQKINNNKIEKVFVIEDQNNNKKFQKLVNEIPLEHIEVTQKIINHAQEVLNTQFHEHIHIALTDHLSFAIMRAKNDLHIKNQLLWEIQRIYPKEYNIGLWATDYIRDKLNVNLTEDEAGFIALHLVNASLGKDMDDTMSITKMVQDILNIIKYHFSVEFNESDISYDRLITHLKYFSHRVVTKNQHQEDQSPLIDLIIENYKKKYDCALKIKDYIEKNYEYIVTDVEIVYLSLHLHRVISRLNN